MPQEIQAEGATSRHSHSASLGEVVPLSMYSCSRVALGRIRDLAYQEVLTSRPIVKEKSDPSASLPGCPPLFFAASQLPAQAQRFCDIRWHTYPAMGNRAKGSGGLGALVKTKQPQSNMRIGLQKGVRSGLGNALNSTVEAISPKPQLCEVSSIVALGIASLQWSPGLALSGEVGSASTASILSAARLWRLCCSN